MKVVPSRFPAGEPVERQIRYYGFYAGLALVPLTLALIGCVPSPGPISTNRSVSKIAQNDLSTIGKVLSIFRLDTGRYPTTKEGIAALYVQPANVTGWHGPYLAKKNMADPWGHSYVYQYPGSRGDDSFLLESYGTSGKSGAPDAIVESK